MPKNETRQCPEDERVFRAVNKRLLLMSGYTETQIRKFGDLAELTTDELHELLTRQPISRRAQEQKNRESTKMS